MVYRNLLIFILFLYIFQAPTSQVVAQEREFVVEYLERFEKSKEYLLEVAELMPEDRFDFKATKESMSFAEHLMHIAWAMDWHCQTLIGDRKARDWDSDTELKVENKSKQEMISKVHETFDKTEQFIKTFDKERLSEKIDYFVAERSKKQILLLLSDHITHHRGQMLVYLRLNDIKPPRYVLYQ